MYPISGRIQSGHGLFPQPRVQDSSTLAHQRAVSILVATIMNPHGEIAAFQQCGFRPVLLNRKQLSPPSDDVPIGSFKVDD